MSTEHQMTKRMSREVGFEGTSPRRSVSPLLLLLSSGLLSSVFAPIADAASDKDARSGAAAAIAPQPADDAPLAFPPMEHYAKLWENSMFTTKALPPPDDTPKGPIFTDNLTLVGMYEVDGAVIGVLLDKVTSGITEVRVGTENESGMKIVRVSPGATPDKTRLQLMKGQEAGWVTFSTEAPPPQQQQPGAGAPAGPGPNGQGGAAGRAQGSAIPGRPSAAPQPAQAANTPRSLPNPSAPNQPAMNQPPQQPQPPPGVQAVPPPAQQVPAPAAAGAGDIPLPPQ